MRKLIFFLTAGVVVLLIIFLFFFFQLLLTPKGSRVGLSVPTPVPLDIKVTTAQSSPNVRYNKQKTDDLLNKVKIRQALSPEGDAAKQKLISSLDSGSGRIFGNSNVSVDYIKSPDLFQAEILTINVTAAKQDAVNFMLSAGFSPSDVCYLPLSFYLNSKVSIELRNSNTIFNPLPEGC